MSTPIKGPEGHPYPCVDGYLNSDGTVSYRATYPRCVRGRNHAKHLGMYANPVVARIAVLEAQAEGLSAKAAEYRAEAAGLAALLPQPRYDHLRDELDLI